MSVAHTRERVVRSLETLDDWVEKLNSVKNKIVITFWFVACPSRFQYRDHVSIRVPPFRAFFSLKFKNDVDQKVTKTANDRMMERFLYFNRENIFGGWKCTTKYIHPAIIEILDLCLSLIQSFSVGRCFLFLVSLRCLVDCNKAYHIVSRQVKPITQTRCWFRARLRCAIDIEPPTECEHRKKQ